MLGGCLLTFKLVDIIAGKGTYLYATAILDDNQKMVGSVLIVDFPIKEKFNEWLKNEPYIKGNVWQEIEVHLCSVPAKFMELHR